MTITGQKATGPGQPEDAAVASPFVIEFFMVQCGGSQHMAYRDHNGRWRSAFSHQELTGDIYILE